jgi:hypothetical protein
MNHLEPDLLIIDHRLDIWSRFKSADRHLGSTLHPIARAMMQAEGAGMAGNQESMPDDILRIDGIIAKAPVSVRGLIHIWYCDSAPVKTKAHRMGISRSKIYQVWHLALRYVQGAMSK